MNKSNFAPKIFVRLVASGLPRLVQHMLSGQFGIISAELGELNAAENRLRTLKLCDKLRGLGLGFANVKGIWRETDLETNVAKLVTERSVFVPGVSREQLLELAADFDQEAIVWGDDGKWHVETPEGVIVAEGNVEEDFVSPLDNLRQKLSEVKGYSEVKDRPFALLTKEERETLYSTESEPDGYSQPREASVGEYSHRHFFSLKDVLPIIQPRCGIRTKLFAAGLHDAWFPLWIS